MIVWIASYPRSGNTLTRMILKSVFGHETYSKYNDLADIGADRKMTELVGHRKYEGEWEIAYRTMKESGNLFFVKTHDGPGDDSKCIYVVRNGCAAIVSYRHYLKDFTGKDCPFIDLAAGNVLFGSWGGHLDAWDPLRRPDTLLIKYEDLLTRPEDESRRIADFLGLDIVGGWLNDFKSFHNVNPFFFRSGDREISEKGLAGDDMEVFSALHGDWLKGLGYLKESSAPGCNSRLLREVFCRALGSMNDLLKQKKEQIETMSFAMRTEISRLQKIAEEKESGIQRGPVTRSSERAAREGEIAALLEERDAERRRLEREIRQKDETHRLQVEEIKSLSEALGSARKEWETERKRFELEMENRARRIRNILNSKSWKMTAPVRAIMDFFIKK
ncbi:MAG: sulfotransferase domain-containing protein [Nitrospirae bacterium]|nr:sulfotransferase domain-containing protein [Nitrospirota bacterium]